MIRNLLFVGCMIIGYLASGQIHEGNYTVTNQAQIDTFNYTEITGSLIIQNTDITNVDGFSELVSIGGSFTFDNNDAITQLDGFNNLLTIGLHFYIRQNDLLQDISGFSSLGQASINVGNSRDYDFFINNNANLNDISGFQNLQSIKADFRIESNPTLNNITGFGELLTTYDFVIYTNPQLNSIDGFENFNSAIEGFYIGENTNLQSINTFENLQSVNNFILQNHPILASILPFSSLQTISNSFTFDNNDAITQLDGFNNLLTIGLHFYIRQNDLLQDISGFSSLGQASINVGNSRDYDFFINNNANLNDISGFQNLQSIKADFRIESNPTLNNITGFGELLTTYDFVIYTNPQLNSIDGFENFNSAIEGFYIGENTNLQSINTFENLQSVNNFILQNNTSLSSIPPFNSLLIVQGNLNIIGNTNLCALTSFTALSSIGSVNISQNEILNNCCILNCIDIETITSGNISIANNAKGCSSLEEVQGLCPAEFCSTPGCQVYDSTNCGCPSDCPNWPQAIFLNSGWNLISFDIVPNDNSIENVFANLIATGNLEFASSYNDGVTTFNPSLPEFLNTLSTVKVGFGYWVKVLNADFLPVDGVCLDDSFRKPLDEGWNLIAFPSDEPLLPEDYFADLIADDNLEFVTGYENGTKTYDPNGPLFLNTIAQMENGFGYWVKVTNAAD